MTERNKKSKSYSLSPRNIEWLAERALALSTAEGKISDSKFLDNLITAKREEHERAARILKQVESKKAPKAVTA
jgi:hypothetical protein